MGVDFSAHTSEEVVRVQATAQEMTSLTQFGVQSRYGVYIRQTTKTVSLLQQGKMYDRVAHEACIASTFSMDDALRKAIIGAYAAVDEKDRLPQVDAARLFKCVVDNKGIASFCSVPVQNPISDVAVVPPPARFNRGKYIRVNMNDFLIEIFTDSVVVKRIVTRMAYGREGHRTSLVKEGRIHPTKRDKDHVSSLYHAKMPYSLFFEHEPSEAFHQGAVTTASHGCIHLDMSDAKWLFEYAGKDQVGLSILAPRGYPIPAAPCSKLGLKFDGVAKCIKA